jgi:hypothetical protein
VPHLVGVALPLGDSSLMLLSILALR